MVCSALSLAILAPCMRHTPADDAISEHKQTSTSHAPRLHRWEAACWHLSMALREPNHPPKMQTQSPKTTSTDSASVDHQAAQHNIPAHKQGVVTITTAAASKQSVQRTCVNASISSDLVDSSSRCFTSASRTSRSNCAFRASYAPDAAA